MTLVIGRRYLLGLPPFGLVQVIYLGPVPAWPKLSRVRNFITQKTVWVKTADLRPLLIDVTKEKQTE